MNLLTANLDTFSLKSFFSRLDTLDLEFFSNSGGSHALNVAIGLIMFGVALELKLDDFKKLLSSPKSVILGLISQFLLLPLVTFLLCIALSPWITPTVALGMVLIAACPGGNVSNFITSMSKGNTALSVSLTAISTSLTVIMTPLNFALYGKWITKFFSEKTAQDMVVPLEIEFSQLFTTIFIILGIPIILGVLFRRYKPVLVERIQPYLKKLSFVLLLAIMGVAIFQNMKYLAQYAAAIFILVAIHNALAFMVGYSFSSAFRLSRYDRRAISIETGIQNGGLALALLFNPKIFPPELPIGGIAFIAAGWGVWHIIGGTILASFWRRRKIENDSEDIRKVEN